MFYQRDRGIHRVLKFMQKVDQFRQALRQLEVEEIIEKFILKEDASEVSGSNIEYIKNAIAASYGHAKESVEIIITGSAKLGFSTSKKFQNGRVVGERYRPFSAESDIDVAVISPKIFDLIWLEIGKFATNKRASPWDSGSLGDYLVYGWLRPDHFPKGQRLYNCDNWFDTFRRLSSNSRFDRHRVSGGIFNSREHLTQYTARSVRECIDQENIR
jgi:hypothetical protein